MQGRNYMRYKTTDQAPTVGLMRGSVGSCVAEWGGWGSLLQSGVGGGLCCRVGWGGVSFTLSGVGALLC